MNIPRVFQERRRIQLIRLIINGLAQAGAAVATAWLVKRVFDYMLTPQTPALDSGLLWEALGLLVAAGFIAGLRLLERVDAERLGQGYTADVRLVLYDRLSSLAPRALQKRSQGGVALRFVGDMSALRRWVSLGLARLAVASVMLVAALSALAVINGPLALVVSVVLGIGAAVAFSLGGRLRTATRESRRRLSHLAANVNEKVSTMAVVQMFGQSTRERGRIARQGQRLQDAMIERARVAGQILGVTEATTALASAAALLMGVFEVAAGQASVGTVAAAMALVGLLMHRCAIWGVSRNTGMARAHPGKKFRNFSTHRRWSWRPRMRRIFVWVRAAWNLPPSAWQAAWNRSSRPSSRAPWSHWSVPMAQASRHYWLWRHACLIQIRAWCGWMVKSWQSIAWPRCAVGSVWQVPTCRCCVAR